MKRVARTLESLVGSLAQLESIAAKAKGITDKDLGALIASAPEPAINSRTAHVGSNVSVGFFQIALANAISELKLIADLTDDEAEFPEFDETPDHIEPDGDELPLVESDPLAELNEENPEVSVDVSIDGEGVEVVNEDGQCYIVLPDNSVMSLHKASAEEASAALDKLNRKRSN